MVSFNAVILTLALSSLTVELIELGMNFNEGRLNKYGIDERVKREGKYKDIQMEIEKAQNLTKAFERKRGLLEEHVIARKKRSPRPVHVLNEIVDAWQWLNTPITEEEVRILERLSMGSPATQEDLDKLFQGFDGDSRITKARSGKISQLRARPREKRFIKAFIKAIINPNGRLPGATRGVNVNSDANWTPRIPTVLSPHSGREQQNFNGGSYSSTSFFNEYDSNRSQQFNEYNGKIKSQGVFDENTVGGNKYFNEYNSANGRVHQRWYDF